MKPNTPMRIDSVSHWLDSCSFLGLASPPSLPHLPLIPLFGACPLLISRGLRGKEPQFGGY